MEVLQVDLYALGVQSGHGRAPAQSVVLGRGDGIGPEHIPLASGVHAPVLDGHQLAIGGVQQQLPVAWRLLGINQYSPDQVGPVGFAGAEGEHLVADRRRVIGELRRLLPPGGDR